ncbi:MAG: hypothetical protein LBJ75_03715 [Puniceicoccales bacterium]|jgi:hypothetical protein|nr:hypothetical protein [Puniceicoccales bacterium]
MAAIGDIIVGGQNGAPTRLPVGAAEQVISPNGTSSIWVDYLVLFPPHRLHLHTRWHKAGWDHHHR